VKNHAKSTQAIYEDISKTLKERNREDEKDKFDKLRKQVERESEEQIRKLENKMNGELAKERKMRCQVEIQNA
jgi:hypothetical protein